MTNTGVRSELVLREEFVLWLLVLSKCSLKTSGATRKLKDFISSLRSSIVFLLRTDSSKKIESLASFILRRRKSSYTKNEGMTPNMERHIHNIRARSGPINVSMSTIEKVKILLKVFMMPTPKTSSTG